MADYKETNVAKKAREAREKKEQEAKLKKQKQRKSLLITVAVLLIIAIITITGFVVSDAILYKNFTQIYTSKLYNSSKTAVADNVKALDGQTVMVEGYMASDSAFSGKMMYIVPTAGQACPFCNDEFAPAVPVLFENGKKIDFYSGRVAVYGTLEVSSKVDIDGFNTPMRIYIKKIKKI